MNDNFALRFDINLKNGSFWPILFYANFKSPDALGYSDRAKILFGFFFPFSQAKLGVESQENKMFIFLSAILLLINPSFYV